MKTTLLLMCGMLTAAGGFAESATPLTLEHALDRARMNSPELRSAGLQTQAAEHAVAAAGLWNNPIVKLEAEGIGGDLDLYDDAEYTFGVHQEFLRGGKRDAERRVALHAVGIAAYAGEERGIELAVQVRRAFVELQAQQEVGKVRAEQLELGQAFVEVARRRFTSGAASQLELVEAELALEEIVLSQTCCFGDLAAAKARLAALIGVPAADLPALTGDYYDMASTVGLMVDTRHPTLMRLVTEADLARAAAEQAKAQDVSDITLGAGYKHEAVADINTFVFSASMPLTFTRRGRVEHAAGLLRVDALQAEREEALRALRQELSILVELHKGAVMETTLTRDKLLPKAEQAYALSREGYEAGRYSWIELITAQQHLSEIRIRYIEALLSVHRIEAELSKFMKEGD